MRPEAAAGRGQGGPPGQVSGCCLWSLGSCWELPAETTSSVLIIVNSLLDRFLELSPGVHTTCPRPVPGGPFRNKSNCTNPCLKTLSPHPKSEARLSLAQPPPHSPHLLPPGLCPSRRPPRRFPRSLCTPGCGERPWVSPGSSQVSLPSMSLYLGFCSPLCLHQRGREGNGDFTFLWPNCLFLH